MIRAIQDLDTMKKELSFTTFCYVYNSSFNSFFIVSKSWIALIIVECCSPSWLPSCTKEIIRVLSFAIHFVHPQQGVRWVAIYLDLACIGSNIVKLPRAVYLFDVVPLFVLKSVCVHLCAALSSNSTESPGVLGYQAAAIVLRASDALGL